MISYTAGNHGCGHMHEDEKYEKFAYSTHFAFSVAKESTVLEEGGYDSMLAVRRQGRDLWHGRSGCDSFRLTEEKVECVWRPMEGVRVETALIPVGKWHIRRHIIHTELPIDIAEGAFAVRRDWAGGRPCDRIASRMEEDARRAALWGTCGSSAIFALKGYDRGRVVWMEPNTNLQYPRTNLPMLLASLPVGTHELICAVYADAEEARPEAVPQEVLALLDTEA